MLAAAQRLRRSTEFAAVVRGGRRAARGAVVVHLAVPTPGCPTEMDRPAPAGPPSAHTGDSSDLAVRAGFVVSKAVGGAVDRNAVRRRLRHLMRDRLPGLPAGSSVVVRAQPGAATTPYPRLGRDLDVALAMVRAPRGAGRARRLPAESP